MDILIADALWLGISLPLSVLAGRALRAPRPTTHRRRFPTITRGLPVATTLFAAVLAIVVASQALPRLPDSGIAAREAAMRLPSSDSSPTTAASRAASASRDSARDRAERARVPDDASDPPRSSEVAGTPLPDESLTSEDPRERRQNQARDARTGESDGEISESASGWGNRWSGWSDSRGRSEYP